MKLMKLKVDGEVMFVNPTDIEWLMPGNLQNQTRMGRKNLDDFETVEGKVEDIALQWEEAMQVDINSMPNIDCSLSSDFDTKNGTLFRGFPVYIKGGGLGVEKIV